MNIKDISSELQSPSQTTTKKAQPQAEARAVTVH